MNIIEFSALYGLHELSGVDFEVVKATERYDEDANVMRLLIDGRIYVATEDPDDGYRSTLGTFELVDGPPIQNTFTPIPVIVSAREHGEDSKSDVIDFVAVATGKIVASVGTENTDDYYPYFVANFDPQAATNASA